MAMKRKTLAAVCGAAFLAAIGGTGVVLADGGRHGGMGGAMHGGMMGLMAERADSDGDGTLSAAEIEAFRDSRFAAMDADGDGTLTPAEMSQGMRALMFDMLDTDGSGAIERAEFMDRDQAQRMGGKRFQRMDRDGDGLVDRDEMGAMTDRMLERLDANGDGVLDADELAEMRGGHRS
jgi:Ca2+-binding EF-hand superfamily protein